jgi:hypothetical protein
MLDLAFVAVVGLGVGLVAVGVVALGRRSRS